METIFNFLKTKIKLSLNTTSKLYEGFFQRKQTLSFIHRAKIRVKISIFMNFAPHKSRKANAHGSNGKSKPQFVLI